MKKAYFVFIFVSIIYILTGCVSLSEDEKAMEAIRVTAQTPEEAMLAISAELLETNEFYGISITDTELIDYVQLNKYENLTAEGTVYSYELNYKFKTDDERAFIDNKITGELIETGVWIKDAVADRCIVLYENNGIYYRILSWDNIVLTENNKTYFRYTNSEYDRSGPSEWLECNIIREIFENVYNIPGLEMSPESASDSILRKLINDIEMSTKPDYAIDITKSRVYNMTYDEELKCIYFRSDLYTPDGEEIVKDTGFSLFLNGGFSIYEVGENNKSIPKSQ